jgi:hypothetical protein
MLTLAMGACVRETDHSSIRTRQAIACLTSVNTAPARDA